MRPVDDLVVHLGVPHTAARRLARALGQLRPQLRDRAVAYVPGEAADRADGPASYADRLQDRATAERRRTATRAGARQTVLVCDDALLGPAALPGQPNRWYPQARALVEPLVAALAPVRTTVLLVVRRQDRWLERQYLDDVLHDSAAAFADWLATLPSTAPDHADLASRLAGTPGVDRLSVLPYESAGSDPTRLVGRVLTAVGVGEDVPLLGLTGRPPRPVCTRRWLAVARALNAELETADERRLVRSFILRTFPVEADRLDLLERPQRRALLASCSEPNRELFRRYLPAADPSAYADDAATERLAALPPGGPGEGTARVGLTARAFRRWDDAPAWTRRAARVVRRRG